MPKLKLENILPLGKFCFEENCMSSGTFIYALENNLPENIKIQTKICKNNCWVYKFDRYQKESKNP